jgi:hypothetical protein
VRYPNKINQRPSSFLFAMSGQKRLSNEALSGVEKKQNGKVPCRDCKKMLNCAHFNEYLKVIEYDRIVLDALSPCWMLSRF